MTIPPETLRIIDANLNRIGEGLRVLEEFARMTLGDAALTQELKNLRHGVVRVDIPRQLLLRARDSRSDVGADMDVPGETKQRGITGTVTANARRVQESLRVMEEMAKTPGLDIDSDIYRQARFTLYEVEKSLTARVLRQEKLESLCGLYVIIDRTALAGRSYKDAARRAIRGGAGAIQLRDKEGSKREMLAAARELKEVCAEQDAVFIVNDSLDVALAADADGLHLGQEDLPVADARRHLPFDKVLGCSARTVEDAVKAQADGADYLGVGAIYPTISHAKAAVVGPERLSEIRQNVNLPLVAIGGINGDNIGEIIAAGAAGAAVINAVLGAEDMEAAARHLAKRIEEAKGA
jgi:thiamine-phosphate pyrophosphorylase